MPVFSLHPARHHRPHPPQAFLIALLLCTIWALLALRLHLHLYPLRAMYQLGERLGITPTPPRGSLGGQILGFNYARPPAWYALLSTALATALALAPAFLPALRIRTRLATGRRAIPARPTTIALRATLALAAAGLAYALLDRSLHWSFYNMFLHLGQWFGGRITALGRVLVGPDGPFTGGATADHLGNLLVAYGPPLVCCIAASAAGLLTHTLLWRRDLRTLLRGTLCPTCLYDCADLTSAHCPECNSIAPTRLP